MKTPRITSSLLACTSGLCDLLEVVDLWLKTSIKADDCEFGTWDAGFQVLSEEELK